MSQTFWETEVKEGEPAVDVPQESAPLALSADDFTALEERVVRTVELVKRERESRAAAEDRASKLDAQVAELNPVVDQLNQEVRTLRAERDQVRQRVERLLKQLDALEL